MVGCLFSFDFDSVFILQDAKKDESVRKSYKYLAALHEVKAPTNET